MSLAHQTLPLPSLSALRAGIDALAYAPDALLLPALQTTAALTPQDRKAITTRAEALVRDIRNSAKPGLMEVFLAEYGLSTDEGVALMCLAEALLRVPDGETIDALIEDKIAPSDWGRHLGHSTSHLVNASTWALMLTGRVLDDSAPGPVGHLRGALKRLGEPVIRTAVGRAMKEMGAQFVLGETIEKAMARGAKQEAHGYTYSYDMLGEAARTEADARRYHAAYAAAIRSIGLRATSRDVRENPGISVKLSALHPRYDALQAEASVAALVPRLTELCLIARDAGLGLNVDAEEADRLSLSLDVIEATLRDPRLAGWEGFGVVVQAYGQRAGAVIDWLHALALELNRKIMVRLVKGAYWDTEIKKAQVAGLDGFPVFTGKAVTDMSYAANARKLLEYSDRIYPQFATHNAQTVSAVLHMARAMALPVTAFEFQRLHGMGEVLHGLLRKQEGTRCRIYAPVGAHGDLLAYLVRRLLENGANSSFVNQIVDETVPPAEVVADPFEAAPAKTLTTGPGLFAPERVNSEGFDLRHGPTAKRFDDARAPFRAMQWQAKPLTVVPFALGAVEQVENPADPQDHPGSVAPCPAQAAQAVVQAAQPWAEQPSTRAAILNRAADLYEAHQGEIFALLAREAGKTPLDAIAELREAVDFLRYYAAHVTEDAARGRFLCISPWNFPLAIFTGQIAAALAAGNAVLAKPAPQTPLVAFRAVQLLHEAGVPLASLQYLPGDGALGAALTQTPGIDGVAFTGSTATAQRIHQNMAQYLDPGAPLIAETGGLNAMIVDSTALPEQAVQAIVESAFQSAGQRCSALRCLYVQEDIAEGFLEMLKGAMDTLVASNPWAFESDLGPVIDVTAHETITAHVARARASGHLLHETAVPKDGFFVAPSLIRVRGIEALTHEVFGPVLHVATFRATELDQVIEAINATGFGLTFGLQTRIDARVEQVTSAVKAGNIYVNRNQIGAVVGSQPFGGEGLSGTGPKAGGPLYLDRFRHAPARQDHQFGAGTRLALPGPTGEANHYVTEARAPLLCLGPGDAQKAAQVAAVEALGGLALTSEFALKADELATLSPLGGVLWWGGEAEARALRQALAGRRGPILALITGAPDRGHVLAERHICIDTTAAGGNASLLAGEG